MISRRQTFKQIAGFAVLAGAAAAKVDAKESSCAVYTSTSQAATTPDIALNRLMEGNARFVAGKTVNCDLMKQVKETANQQSPVAVVVGCIDSRVPPELVFDQRLGDIWAKTIIKEVEEK